jgi:hypothetical protein
VLQRIAAARRAGVETYAGPASSFCVADLRESWYRLTQAGRKRVLCLPNGPGSANLLMRRNLTIRQQVLPFGTLVSWLRYAGIRKEGDPADPVSPERFDVWITGISSHSSVRAILELEGLEMFPGLISDEMLQSADREVWNYAAATQVDMFSGEMLECVKRWGS